MGPKQSPGMNNRISVLDFALGFGRVPHPLRFPRNAGAFGCAEGNISPGKCTSEHPGLEGDFKSTGPDYPENTDILKIQIS